MEENQLDQKDNYKTRKQQEILEQKLLQRKKAAKRWSKILIIFVSIAGFAGALVWYATTRSSAPTDEIVSRRGMHWHSQLSVEIKGQKQEIPVGIGLGVVHDPIHTHDATGEIHMEFPGMVRQNDIRLDQFFKVWGKRFDSNCIFDFCNGPDGMIKMFVNGAENMEFENYHMKDRDKIEIKYDK